MGDDEGLRGAQADVDGLMRYLWHGSQRYLGPDQHSSATKLFNDLRHKDVAGTSCRQPNWYIIWRHNLLPAKSTLGPVGNAGYDIPRLRLAAEPGGSRWSLGLLQASMDLACPAASGSGRPRLSTFCLAQHATVFTQCRLSVCRFHRSWYHIQVRIKI